MRERESTRLRERVSKRVRERVIERERDRVRDKESQFTPPLRTDSPFLKAIPLLKRNPPLEG